MSLCQDAKTDGSTWDWVELGEREVAAAERHALGTSARVAVWPPQQLSRALGAVDRELAALDQQASRFREDSEISMLNRSKGHIFFLSEGLGEAMAAALAAASWTDGMVDPTVGQALMSLGYDRDFAAMATEDGSSVPLGVTVPGWSSVH